MDVEPPEGSSRFRSTATIWASGAGSQTLVLVLQTKPLRQSLSSVQPSKGLIETNAVAVPPLPSSTWNSNSSEALEPSFGS